MPDETRMTRDQWQILLDELKERARNPDAAFTFEEFQLLNIASVVDRIREIEHAIEQMRHPRGQITH